MVLYSILSNTDGIHPYIIAYTYNIIHIHIHIHPYISEIPNYLFNMLDAHRVASPCGSTEMGRKVSDGADWRRKGRCGMGQDLDLIQLGSINIQGKSGNNMG